MLNRKVPIIEKCPHTDGVYGVITIPQSILSEINGALRANEHMEWLIVLLGTQREGRVTITGYRVPQQTRCSVNCEIHEAEEVQDNEIGVLHSHHTMPAFFSQTDKTKLNPRFACSIVVSTQKHTTIDHLLGFSYQAEGRLILPCQHDGLGKYSLLPEPLPPTWPEERRVPVLTSPKPTKSLGDCCFTHNEPLNALYDRQVTACGLALKTHRQSIFGATETLAEEITKKTTTPTFGIPPWQHETLPWLHRKGPWTDLEGYEYYGGGE